jgi:hypothetical protein
MVESYLTYMILFLSNHNILYGYYWLIFTIQLFQVPHESCSAKKFLINFEAKRKKIDKGLSQI